MKVGMAKKHHPVSAWNVIWTGRDKAVILCCVMFVMSMGLLFHWS